MRSWFGEEGRLDTGLTTLFLRPSKGVAEAGSISAAGGRQGRRFSNVVRLFLSAVTTEKISTLLTREHKGGTYEARYMWNAKKLPSARKNVTATRTSSRFATGRKSVISYHIAPRITSAPPFFCISKKARTHLHLPTIKPLVHRIPRLLAHESTQRCRIEQEKEERLVVV